MSPDEKWIVADMWNNMAEGKADVICTFRRGNTHPAHPHPNFSPDGKSVAFVVADGKNTCQVAVIDVTKAKAALEH